MRRPRQPRDGSTRVERDLVVDRRAVEDGGPVAVRFEEVPVGYPGFEVMRPQKLRPTPAALKRIALAKLTGIVRFSAEFGGEQFLFEPWLTVLVDYTQGALLAGVYRTDLEQAPGTPHWCLRRSEWIRAKDHEMAGAAGDRREYLSSGPQIANRFVFADRVTHPEIELMMEEMLTALGSGVTVAPAKRTHKWQWVELDLVDDRLSCVVWYSPLLARSDAFELALPSWLDRFDGLVRRDGFPPDGKGRISIQRSVPEMVNDV